MKAVAHVTLNRAEYRGLSIKSIVNQPYQFSWMRQVKDHVPNDWSSFLRCAEAVVLAANEPDFTGGANFYHLNTIKPKWASDPGMRYVGKHGSHLFYINKPKLRIKKDKVKKRK
jgi:spore germination cell wall hydrolase CwlJ-like protein